MRKKTPEWECLLAALDYSYPRTFAGQVRGVDVSADVDWVAASPASRRTLVRRGWVRFDKDGKPRLV